MKTTRTKHRFFLRLVAAILFLSSSAPSFGQELIRKIDAHTMQCDTSIIRDISRDSVIIYNQLGNTSVFMVVPSGVYNVPTMDIYPFYVIDFEIFKNDVYFCGYLIENEMAKAVIGCFPLNGFPLVPIYYYKTGQCEEFRKLDVYEAIDQFANEIHVVATGSTDGVRMDVLVDMSMTTPSGPNCMLHVSNDENESFDDVAVTDNRVIVSSRNFMSSIPIVRFWQYMIPTSFGQSIFNNAVNSIYVSSPFAGSPVFLEHSLGENYAAVYQDGVYPRIAILFVDALNPTIKSVEIIAGNPASIHPMDIKFNSGSGVYDILARDNPKGSSIFFPETQIYHVTPKVINHTVSYGIGTRFTDHFVWSIDPRYSHKNQFVASGSKGLAPCFFRYSYLKWDYCPQKFIYLFDTGEMKKNIEEEIHHNFIHLQLDLKEFNPNSDLTFFPVVCGQD